jgi:hypothetical protein
MSNVSSNALATRVSKKHEQWLEKLPQLEGNEARLLELIERCYSTFLAGTAGVRDLALEYNIPVEVIATWAREGKWLRRRDDFRQELLVSTEMDYAEFIRKNRVKTAEEIVAKLQPKIGEISDAIATALSLGEYTNVRRLAESLKHVSDIVTKTVGLDAPIPVSDRPAMQKGSDDSGVKQPFFNINTRGPVQITPAREEQEEKVIDVES